MSGTILVLEDEAVVAIDIANELRDAGWTVVGPAGSVAKAERLVDAELPHAALLDVNLNGTDSFDLAARLIDEGVNIIFLTGYTSEFIPDKFSDCPVIAKPVDMYILDSTLQKIMR